RKRDSHPERLPPLRGSITFQVGRADSGRLDRWPDGQRAFGEFGLCGARHGTHFCSSPSLGLSSTVQRHVTRARRENCRSRYPQGLPHRHCTEIGRRSGFIARTSTGRGTINWITRFVLMSIDALTGVIAVSLVVALICHLCPPPDDNSGPGGNA